MSRRVQLYFLSFSSAIYLLEARSYLSFSRLGAHYYISETDSLPSSCFSRFENLQLHHLPSLLLPTPLETRDITLSTQTLFQVVFPNLVSESLPLIHSSQETSSELSSSRPRFPPSIPTHLPPHSSTRPPTSPKSYTTFGSSFTRQRRSGFASAGSGRTMIDWA